MNHLGTAPAPGPPAPEADDQDIPLWMLAVGIIVALALAASVAVLVMRETGRASQPAAGPTHPEKWDKRVRPYVKVVEKERGLDFRHPVAVRFLPAARFEKTVTSGENKPTAQERRDIDHFSGTMRALGLLDGDVDLFRAVNDTTQAAYAAYYSYVDQRITIRGRKLTPEVRSTLVHELTHALQDQHFGIGSRFETLRKASENGPDSTAASVYRAIVEGDATLVQERYRASLPPRQQQALDRGRAGEEAQVGKRLSRVPTVVRTMFTSPYTLGSGLVGLVDADGGNAAVDGLLQDPPTHENALLDPFGVLQGGTEVRPLPLQKTRKGEKKLDSGEFGALTWYLMLAERLPLPEALAAADAWAGDTYLSYQADGSSCVRLAVTGGRPAATGQLHEALRRWATATPDTTRVSRAGSVVRLESCDPGPAAPGGNDVSDDAVALVATRAGLGIGMLRSQVPPYRASCLADGLLRTYSVAQLRDPDFGAEDPVVQARIQQLAAGCG